MIADALFLIKCWIEYNSESINKINLTLSMTANQSVSNYQNNSNKLRNNKIFSFFHRVFSEKFEEDGPLKIFISPFSRWLCIKSKIYVENVDTSSRRSSVSEQRFFFKRTYEIALRLLLSLIASIKEIIDLSKPLPSAMQT